MDYPALRRDRLAALVKEENLDAVLIGNPVNVTYLTGFSGDSSTLIIGRERNIMVSDGRFTEQLAEECPGLETHIRPSRQNIVAASAEALAKLGFNCVGFESAHVSVAELEAYQEKAPAITWKGGRDRVEKLRAVKDPSEIDEIREAIHIAEKAFDMFRALLRPDDSEKELGDAMESYVRRAGGRCCSFPSIVAVAERAALPHAPLTDRTVGECRLLLVDWGASGRFYKSDLTRVLIPRTFAPFSGPRPRNGSDGKLEKVYDVVLRAQLAGIAAIRPGVKGHDVDAAARTVIADAGFADHFVHAVGHGLGLQVHEAPSVRNESADELKAGMVITVEPGIYLPGWGGIRIEDDVLVTADGAEVLTHVPKEFESAVVDF